MNLQRVASEPLHQVAADQDFLRSLFQSVLQEFLEAEMSEARGIDQGLGRRVPDRAGNAPAPLSP